MFCLFLLQINQKNSFFIGWIFGTGFFLGSMHWIVFPFLIYEEHLFLSPIVLIIFPVSLGLFFSIPSLFLHNFIKIVNSDFLYLKSFSLSFFFLLSELIRSNIFGGLPFNLTAQIWAFNFKFIQIVSFIGVYGLSFLTINWLVILSYLILQKRKSFFAFFLNRNSHFERHPWAPLLKISAGRVVKNIAQNHCHNSAKWSNTNEQQQQQGWHQNCWDQVQGPLD